MFRKIETKNLILRQLNQEDAASVFEYASCADVARYTSWVPHTSLDDSKSFISSIRYSSHNLGPYGICLKESQGHVIGMVQIISTKRRFEGQLAYSISQKFWRRGYGFEAAFCLIQKSFEEKMFKRISAKCGSENISSKHLLKKLGMQCEGCARSRYYKGRFWDLEFYAILEREWESIGKAALCIDKSAKNVMTDAISR